MSARILVIEDEADIARAVRAVFEGGGLAVLAAADGRAGLHAFHASRPDAVVLDLGLPVLDGWAVLDRIREISEVPVLLLTSRHSVEEKVRGLRAGADDYVTKPFSNAELLARVEALLRRAGPRTGEPGGAEPGAAEPAGAVRAGSSPAGASVDRASVDRASAGRPSLAEAYDDGLVRVAFADSEVRVSEQPVSLTPTEFRLLAALVRHPAQILSPEQLLAQAWQDPAGIGPDRVKFAVMRLRRKLGQHGADGPIEAVRGFGYRYRPPPR